MDRSSYDSKNKSNIYYLALNSGIKDLVLVEDSMTGFLECYKNCMDLKLNLIFGLRLNLWEGNFNHKVVVFAKNKSGIENLNKLSTAYNTSEKKSFSLSDLKTSWSEDFSLYIPFYDSFLHQNIFTFSNLNPLFDFAEPSFFIESNGLPFDFLLKQKTVDYCLKNNYNYFNAKSIYYNKKSDLLAYQTYKCICSRSFSKSITLDKPNLEHCSSDEFSFESYLNHEIS